MSAWGYFAAMEDREGAMKVAYGDVERAWLHYVKHYNPGLKRPFIIAGHSQGTEHAVRLLKKHRDSENGAFKRSLVAAYLVGAEVYPSQTGFKPCEMPTSTSCIVGWRSYGENVDPEIFRVRTAVEALRTMGMKKRGQKNHLLGVAKCASRHTRPLQKAPTGQAPPGQFGRRSRH